MGNGAKLMAALCLVVLGWTASAADHKDGYVFRNGKVLVFRDGRESVVTAEVRLHNGARLLPDGFIVFTDGRRERFREDRWLSLEGEYIVVDATDDFDGYWYEGGHVYVMREHRPVIVTVAVTLNDGSRIEPSGVLILRDGSRSQLTAGVRVTREGKRVEHNGASARVNAVDKRETPIDTSRKVEDNVKSREAEAAKAPEKREATPVKPPEKREETPAKPQEKREEKTETRGKGEKVEKHEEKK